MNWKVVGVGEKTFKWNKGKQVAAHLGQDEHRGSIYISGPV